MQVKINETQDKLHVTVTIPPARANEKPRRPPGRARG